MAKKGHVHGHNEGVLKQLTGVRYVVPFREGGSLPAVIETAEDGAYVVKFRGAGQGVKVLVAEAIAAGLAGALGFNVPAPAAVLLEEGFGRAEPDPEIQDILRGSTGLNFGLAYLAGALAFDPVVDRDLLSAEEAANVVWLDALITNIDRTARNANLLVCRERVWLIDHGASLYFHFRWSGWQERIQAPFPQIKDHILLPLAGDIGAADERLRGGLSEEVLRAVVAGVPDDWLGGEPEHADRKAHRQAYVTYLVERLNGPCRWLQEAIDARGRGAEPLAVRATHRVE